MSATGANLRLLCEFQWDVFHTWWWFCTTDWWSLLLGRVAFWLHMHMRPCIAVFWSLWCVYGWVHQAISHGQFQGAPLHPGGGLGGGSAWHDHGEIWPWLCCLHNESGTSKGTLINCMTRRPTPPILVPVIFLCAPYSWDNKGTHQKKKCGKFHPLHALPTYKSVENFSKKKLKKNMS